MYKNYTNNLGVPNPHIYKILLIMRLTIVLLLVMFVQVSANTFGQSITLNVKNAPLSKIIKEIRTQSGYDFFYSKDLLSRTKNITINVKNASIQEVLDKSLADQNLVYKIDNKAVMIRERQSSLLDRLSEYFAGTIDVRGQVLDSLGTPLVGASVRLKTSKTGVNTNANGEFSLAKLKAGDIIVVSYIGYLLREITVTAENASGMQIMMRADVGNLSEVSVVSNGYQTISKERSAGSFAKPDMSVMYNRSISMNVLQRLDGLVPGLTINNAPGNAANSILVRGLTTIGTSGSAGYAGTNRSPLIVVDGIPLDDAGSINPQDVSDITVLKDATAASIWGSRASNGVIVITTKKGKQGDKVRVSYDGFVNMQGKPNLNYIPVLSSRQFIQAAKDVFDPVNNLYNTAATYVNQGSSGIAPHEMILYRRFQGLLTDVEANAKLDSLGNINNRGQIEDLFYRNAMLTNHTVSASGGGKVYSFYGSLAYTGAESVKPKDKDNTYKINFRHDVRFNDIIQMYLITDLTNQLTSSKNIPNISSRFYPYQLFRDASGKNIDLTYMTPLTDSLRDVFTAKSKIRLDYSPLSEIDLADTQTDALLNRISSGITAKLFKGLRFEGVFGYIKGNTKTKFLEDQESYAVRNEVVQFAVAPTGSGNVTYYMPEKGGRLTTTNQNQRSWTARSQLAYDNSWNKGMHNLTILAGHERQDKLITSNSYVVRGYDKQLLSFDATINYDLLLSSAGLANPVMPNGSNRSILAAGSTPYSFSDAESRFISYYSNAAYTFKNKYTINGSWRIDQSNLFGKEKSAQNKPVYSAGAKWLVSGEPFMASLAAINEFALRATYGITGNAPLPGTGASKDILQAGISSAYPGGVGFNISTPGNPDLTWESTKTINLGIDFGVLKNRLSGSIDLYQKKTKGLLGALAVNGFTGVSSVTGNLGDLRNKGMELSLRSLNINTRNFHWRTNLVMAYNQNKITRINNLAAITTGAQQVDLRYASGYSAFSLFAYQFAGLDEMGDPRIYLNDKTTTKTKNVSKPGDIKFMGSYQPAWNGGISNMFEYKNLSLGVNIVYSLDYIMRRDVNDFYTGRLTHNSVFYSQSSIRVNGEYLGNLNADFANRWKNPGDEKFTNIPAYISNLTTSVNSRDINYYTKADINVTDASYLKIRDINFGYNLPRRWLSGIKTENISLRLQVSNLMLWKANHYGIDPEFQDPYYGSRSIPVNQRTVTIGVHVNL
jgi:TonB-linked SusC/RagA family outer membrane protein